MGDNRKLTKRTRSLFLFLVTVLLLLAPLRIYTVNADPGWLSGWDQRVKISVDYNDVDSTLTNFPVLIYISSDSGIDSDDITFIFDEVGANRWKIAVTEDDGLTQCYVEVEQWESGNEKAWLWFKAPSLNSTVNTDFYLYYDVDHADNTAYVGDPNSATAENVWDSNYKFVSHMRDDPDNAHIRDSTTNDNDGTKINVNSPMLISAYIGEGQDFSGSDEWISPPDMLTGFDPQLNITVEGWVKTDVINPIGHSQIMVYGEGGEWQLHIRSGTDDFEFMVKDLGGWKRVPYMGISIDTYYHVTGTWDGEYISIFVDGAYISQVATGDTLDEADSTIDCQIGKYGGPDYIEEWNGILDEIRVSQNVRSNAWIETTYESGKDHLLTFGSEETSSQEYDRFAYQSIGMVMGATRGIEVTRGVTQALTTALSVSRSIEVTRIVTQSLTTALATSRTLEIIRSASQTLSVIISTSRIFEQIVSVTQGIAVSLSALATYSMWRTPQLGISIIGETTVIGGTVYLGDGLGVLGFVLAIMAIALVTLRKR